MISTRTSKSRWMEDSDGAWICFQVPKLKAAEICSEMKSGKPFDISVKLHRNKRSLDANAYMWTLIGKLSEKLHISPMEIYRSYIPDIGGNYEIIPVRADKIEAWDKIWTNGHEGRQTVDLGPCRNIEGYHNIKTFIGSSDYDTAQMSRLLELVIDDCKQNNIETLTPFEKAALIAEWGERNNYESS